MVKSNIQPNWNYKASKYQNQSNIDQNITDSAYSFAMFKMMDSTQMKTMFNQKQRKPIKLQLYGNGIYTIQFETI